MSSSAILLAWERPLYNSDKVIAYSVHYMKAEGESSGAAAKGRDEMLMVPGAFRGHGGPTVELLLYMSDLQGFQQQVLPS